jgi:hypothetical protein
MGTYQAVIEQHLAKWVEIKLNSSKFTPNHQIIPSLKSLDVWRELLKVVDKGNKYNSLPVKCMYLVFFFFFLVTFSFIWSIKIEFKREQS